MVMAVVQMCKWQKREVMKWTHLVNFSSVQSLMFDSLGPHGLQHARIPCPSPTPGAYSSSCPLCLWCHPTVSSSVISLLLPSIFPCIREFPAFSNQSLHIRWPKYLSFSFTISPSNEYSGLISWRIDWVWSPCCPRDSQESSPIQQFKSINSLALNFLYSPTLTSIHDCWKNHSWLDRILLAKWCLCFLVCCLGWS